MRVEIIKLENSRGLRIPKTILEQCEMKDSVDLRVKDHTLIITPCMNTKTGWEESFKLMAKNNDDALLDIGSSTYSWDEDEWQW